MPSAPDSIGFVYEATMLRITDVKRSTLQNWEGAEIFATPQTGRFRERDVVEVAIVAVLVDALGKKLADVATTWRPERDAILRALLSKNPTPGCLLLIEPRLLRLETVDPDSSIEEVLRPGEATIAVPVTELVRGLRKDFWRFAQRDTKVTDGRRRDSRTKQQTRRRQSG